MPPAEGENPPADSRAAAVKWLDQALFYCDCSQPPDPGRVTVRRLNRAEYNNTVRDLLGVDFQPANDFPPDETGQGFDNTSEVLTVPPLLLEKYLDAAEKIADQSVRVHSPDYSRLRYAGRELNDNARMVQYSFDLPRKGRYVIRFEARQEAAGDEPTRMEIRVGRNQVLETIAVKNSGAFEMFESRKISPGSA